MEFLKSINDSYIKAVADCFGVHLESDEILINETRKEFEGDYTFVIFPLVKKINKSPEEIGNAIGNWLLTHESNVIAHNTVKGFLNLSLSCRMGKK
jgi:arginyl-tRNA synthetase